MATNFEYYKDEILKISGSKMEIAIVNNRPVPCEETNCDACDFRGFCSEWNLVVWLYAEHIEQPKLTKRERAFCEAVQTGWIYGMLSCRVWSEIEPEKDNCLIFGEDDEALKIPSCLNLFCWIKKHECYSVEYLLKLEFGEGQDARDMEGH